MAYGNNPLTCSFGAWAQVEHGHSCDAQVLRLECVAATTGTPAMTRPSDVMVPTCPRKAERLGVAV